MRVAAAGGGFQPGMIDDADVAAPVADEAAPLQGGGRRGDPDPAHAEHVREELLREVEFPRADAIARHQQPAREARLDPVKAIARGGLGDLRHQRGGVAMQRALQRDARPQALAQARGAHAQRAAAALHQGAHRRDADAERERDPDHALVPHQPDFERAAAVDDGEQRHYRAAGEVDVAHRGAGLVEHVAEDERRGREARRELPVGRARQRGEQAVGGHAPLWAAPRRAYVRART